jgi:hypothetical protein
MRLAGMAAASIAVAAIAGCSMLEQQISVSPTPTPSPFIGSSARPPWIEDLTFSGDLAGTMNQVVAGSGGTRTICTGQRGQGGDTWVLTLFGPVGRTTYGLQVTVSDYRGPGMYRAPQASMQVFKADDSLGWQSLGGDQVSLMLDTSRESGTVEATLTNLTNDSSKVRVSGHWTCR